MKKFLFFSIHEILHVTVLKNNLMNIRMQQLVDNIKKKMTICVFFPLSLYFYISHSIVLM